MKTQIIFIDDLAATGGQVFIAQLKTRMALKGFKIIEKHLFTEGLDFLHIFKQDYSIKSEEVFFSYLNSIFSFYTEIVNMQKINQSEDICYFIKGVPFLYNFYKYICNNYVKRNQNAIKVLRKFSQIIRQTTAYISLDSYTDVVKDHLDQKDNFQKEYYNFILNGETSTKAKIIAIEDIKQALLEGFYALRKEGVNCIKCSINFGEDISDNIIKVFDYLRLY